MIKNLLRSNRQPGLMRPGYYLNVEDGIATELNEVIVNTYAIQTKNL